MNLLLLNLTLFFSGSLLFSLAPHSSIDPVEQMYLQMREHSLIKGSSLCCSGSHCSKTSLKELLDTEKKYAVKNRVNEGLISFMVEDAAKKTTQNPPSTQQINAYRLQQAKQFLKQIKTLKKSYLLPPFSHSMLYSEHFFQTLDHIIDKLKSHINSFSIHLPVYQLFFYPLEEDIDIYTLISQVIIPTCLFFSHLSVDEQHAYQALPIFSHFPSSQPICYKTVFDSIFSPFTTFLSLHPLWAPLPICPPQSSLLIIQPVPHSSYNFLSNNYFSNASKQVISHSQINPIFKLDSSSSSQTNSPILTPVDSVFFTNIHGRISSKCVALRLLNYYLDDELEPPYFATKKLIHLEQLYDFTFLFVHFMRTHNIQPKQIFISACNLNQRNFDLSSNIELITYWLSQLLPFQPHPIEINCISADHAVVSDNHQPQNKHSNVHIMLDNYYYRNIYLSPFLCSKLTDTQSPFSLHFSNTTTLPHNLLFRLFIFPDQLKNNLPHSEWLKSPFLSLIPTISPFIHRLRNETFSYIFYQNILEKEQTFDIHSFLPQKTNYGIYFVLVNPVKTIIIHTSFMPWFSLDIESIRVCFNQDHFFNFNQDDFQYLFAHIINLLSIPLSTSKTVGSVPFYLRPYPKCSHYFKISPQIHIFTPVHPLFVCDLIDYQQLIHTFSNVFPHNHSKQSSFSIHKACALGDLKMTRFLIESNPHCLSELNLKKQTPLEVATECKQTEIVDYLTSLPVLSLVGTLGTPLVRSA